MNIDGKYMGLVKFLWWLRRSIFIRGSNSGEIRFIYVLYGKKQKETDYELK